MAYNYLIVGAGLYGAVMAERLRATEGSLAPVACLEYEVNDCPRASQCATLYVWEGLAKAVSDYLDSITLQDIIDRSSGSTAGDDYCI